MASQSLGGEDVEILVHITAPCIPPPPPPPPHPRIDEEHPDENGEQQEQQPSSRSSRPEPAEEPAAFPPSLVPESQELSFDDALGNPSSFRERNPAFNHASSATTSPAKAWHSPPSHISDSYPLPDTTLLNTSPGRALERCFQGFAPAPAPRAPASVSGDCSSPLQTRARAASVELQAGGGGVDVPSSVPVPDSQDRTHDGAAKVIPVTPMVPRGQHLGKRKAQADEAYDETVIEKTRLPSSQATHVSESFSQRAESAPPASKRPRTVVPSDLGLVRSSSDIGPQISRTVAPTTATAPAAGAPPPPPTTTPDPEAAILEIRPPSPPPGIAALNPSDLVSEKLSQLRHELASRFRADKTRPIDPFERGYWLLDCTSWTPTVRRNAWRFLTQYLRRGLAGWGVWCLRDEGHDWIRLYCWGYVAEHTFCLLYLASERQVKVCGARWIGADEEVVLDVLPRA